MERSLIPNTASRIQLCGELAGGLQGVARPCRGSVIKIVKTKLYKIFWSEILSSASAKFGISSVSAIILVFRLPFSFYNLVIPFSFCKFVLCFGVIV